MPCGTRRHGRLRGAVAPSVERQLREAHHVAQAKCTIQISTAQRGYLRLHPLWVLDGGRVVFWAREGDDHVLRVYDPATITTRNRDAAVCPTFGTRPGTRRSAVRRRFLRLRRVPQAHGEILIFGSGCGLP